MAKNNTENIILAGLLANGTVAGTAKVTGISESTIFKYLRDENFKAKYAQAKFEMLKQSASTLQANIQKAVAAIVEIIEDLETPPQIKLNAADMLLRNNFKFTEQIEILRRLDELERLQKQQED